MRIGRLRSDDIYDDDIERIGRLRSDDITMRRLCESDGCAQDDIEEESSRSKNPSSSAAVRPASSRAVRPAVSHFVSPRMNTNQRGFDPFPAR